MPRRNFAILLAAIAVWLLCVARDERNPYARYAARGYRLIDELALEEPTDRELLVGAMRGMVAVLRERGDEHSAYIEPRDAEPLLAEMRQEFGGIGVRIQLEAGTEEGDPPRLVVVEPPEPGGPAFRAGVRAGDTITAVDGETISKLSMADVLSRMRGAPSTPIELTLRREGQGEPLALRMLREVIRLPSVVGDRRLPDGSWRFLLEDEPRVALLRIRTFGNKTAEELEEALAGVVATGAEAVVIDVRNNAGGALDAAVDVADLFLPAGAEVLTTRGRDGGVLLRYAAAEPAEFADLPLAVLVDRNSASAAEIVAACLQDHGRAVVVGERSYGKGTVQQLLPLEAGRSLLKLTSASYWRPSGVNIHRSPGRPASEAWGVSPESSERVALSDERYAAWLAWRRSRDLLAEADGETIPPAPIGDDDPVLRHAIDSLLPLPGDEKN